ncbi:MAG: hypothetical protein KGK35_05845, partial [Xanthomonadaceae bacterium]|nr:hypothetical protein [Xanthomonadaceae bacterium]
AGALAAKATLAQVASPMPAEISASVIMLRFSCIVSSPVVIVIVRGAADAACRPALAARV